MHAWSEAKQAPYLLPLRENAILMYVSVQIHVRNVVHVIWHVVIKVCVHAHVMILTK
jgi:hypothetical protein